MAGFIIIHRDNEYDHDDFSKDKKAQKEWYRAIEYLMRAAPTTTNKVMDVLNATNKTIIVSVDTALERPQNEEWDNCWIPVRKVGEPLSLNASTIRWWAGKQKEWGKRGAELGLLHELGHECQWLKQKEKIRRKIRRVKENGEIEYTNFFWYLDNMEEWVVSKIETPAAKEINDYILAVRARDDVDNPGKFDYLLEPIRKQYHKRRGFNVSMVPFELDKKLLFKPKKSKRTKAKPKLLF